MAGPHPDLGRKFGNTAAEQRSGFRYNVSALRLPSHFNVSAVVVLEGRGAVPLAKIQGIRSTLRSGYRPKLQPLMLSCLGRSGSTWVAHLLGQHPEIVTYGTFQLEPRLAGYWLDDFGTLAEPASYAQTLRPEVTGEDWWAGQERRTVLSLEPIDVGMAHWLGGEAVASLAAFCMARVDEFYSRAARDQAKNQVRFYAERTYGIGSFAPRMMWELYSGVREIVLVRDFRDVFCSMKVFKGSSLPRRHLARDDADYVRHQLKDYVCGLHKRWVERSDTAHVLRYEDLVRQPHDTLATLFNYVGVDSGAATVDRLLSAALRAESEGQARHRTSSDPQSSIGRWRDELDKPVRRAFEEALGQVLRDFGYATESHGSSHTAS